MFEVKMYSDPKDFDGTIIHYGNSSKIKLTSGNIAKGINVVDSFTFTMNMANPAYTKIETFKTLIAVRNTKTGLLEFDGYVQQQNGSMDDSGQYTKEVSCVSVLNYLKDSLAGYGEFHDMTPKDFFTHLINVHNKQVEPHKQFIVRNVDVTNTTDNLYRYTSQETDVFETIMDKLVDRLGGELRVERVDGKLYIDWLKKVGEVKEQTEIRVGKNLKAASRDEETEDVKTRWVILGAEIEKEDNENVADDDAYAAKERITIASVNNGKDYLDDTIAIARFGIKKGVKVFDGVRDKNILLTKGKNFIANNKMITISNQVTALDLSLIGKNIDSFEVFNWYPLNNPALAAKENVRVIEKRIDIISPQSSSLTLGDTYLTASKYQAAIRKNQKEYDRVVGRVDTLVKSNISLSQTLKSTQNRLENIQEQLTKADLDNLPTELQSIVNQIEELQNSIGNIDIPEYEPATYLKDGLMSATDKVKLDSLKKEDLATTISNGLMSKEDKEKLDLIKVLSEIDLDKLREDVDTLMST